MVDKIINKMLGWKGKLMSYSGRLTLHKDCLTSIPIYLMLVIKFPKWATETINFEMVSFF
jgi:hypothetical protein